MAQIQSGTCSVKSGDAVVIASPNNDWSQVQIALGYGFPVYFSTLNPNDVLYRVLACQSAGVSKSGNWEITLSMPWMGDTIPDRNENTLPVTVYWPGAPYMIHKDFSPNLGLPLPGSSDRQWTQLLSLAFSKLDANWGAGPGVPPLLPDTVGVTATVQAGWSMYVIGQLDVPYGTQLDILAGGAVEVG